MLAIPPLLGAAAGWPLLPSALLLAAALLLLFLARHAAVPTAARVVQGKAVSPGLLPARLLWCGLYVAASLGFLVAGLRATPPASRGSTLAAALATALLGGAQTVLALAGRDRSTIAELLGMAGLASAAPLIIVSCGRPLDGRAVAVGLLAFAYFLSSLAYVRAVRRLWHADRSAAGRCLLAHAGVIAGLVVLWGLGWLPGVSLLALAPVVARTVWGLVSPPGTLRALGFREIGVAVLFAGAAALALPLG
jgi:hypothetical protein